MSIAVPTKTAVRGVSLVRRAGENIIGNTSARDESVAGLGGDIGARDATPGEIESGFNAKSIGEADTEHMLKVPEGIREVTELVNRSCVALDGSEGTLDDEAQKLVYQKQVADWKIRMVDGHEVLRREYRTANADDAKEVINRLNTVAVSFSFLFRVLFIYVWAIGVTSCFVYRSARARRLIHSSRARACGSRSGPRR